MWHAGTLDPLATGLLLIATGNYTKLLHYLEKSDKVYEFSLMLDGTSDSFDCGTEIRYITHTERQKAKKTITKETITHILKKHFTWKIKQKPPKYSAIKINGKKALDRVRAWEDFEIKEKDIEIFDIQIQSFEYPLLKLSAHVSSGTYIRSIARDLGKILETGAYVQELRRIKIGWLKESESQELENFDVNKRFDIWKLFPTKDCISVNPLEEEELSHGRKIVKDFSWKEDTPYFVRDGNMIRYVLYYDGSYLLPERKIIV